MAITGTTTPPVQPGAKTPAAKTPEAVATAQRFSLPELPKADDGFSGTAARSVSSPSVPTASTASSQALWGGAPKTGGAPLLADVPAEQVVPPAVMKMSPLERHLWFFKAAPQMNGQPASQIALDPAKDHSLSFDDLKTGLNKLGINGPAGYALAAGVLVDRGGRQLFKGEGSFGSIDIGNANFWSTGHQDNARSGVYDEAGNVDPAKEQQFLDQLDPNYTGKITMDQFKAVGKELATERDAGHGPLAALKRWNDEGTFDRAWNSFMKIAGHTDPATGQQYVTRDDVKWFHDGTYFFRLAEAKQAAARSA
jgi:hypothetical protein